MNKLSFESRTPFFRIGSSRNNEARSKEILGENGDECTDFTSQQFGGDGLDEPYSEQNGTRKKVLRPPTTASSGHTAVERSSTTSAAMGLKSNRQNLKRSNKSISEEFNFTGDNSESHNSREFAFDIPSTPTALSEESRDSENARQSLFKAPKPTSNFSFRQNRAFAKSPVDNNSASNKSITPPPIYARSPNTNESQVGKILSFLSTNLSNNENQHQERIANLEKNLSAEKVKSATYLGKINSLVKLNCSQHEKIENCGKQLQSLDSRLIEIKL